MTVTYSGRTTMTAAVVLEQTIQFLSRMGYKLDKQTVKVNFNFAASREAGAQVAVWWWCCRQRREIDADDDEECGNDEISPK